MMTLKVLDYEFEGPFLTKEYIREEAGVYLVTKGEDDDYEIIDVGISENLKERIANHDRKDCWHEKAKLPKLWVRYTPTDESGAYRRHIELEIREAYPKIRCGER